ncbi:hypothetical protein Tco_1398078 [Tanacetum coccineum]
MYASTISSKSLADSTRSSLLPALLLHLASVVDSDSEHFEDPTSPVVSDSDSFVASLNSEPFEDCVSQAVFAASNPDDEPLGSSDTSDYYEGSKFSKEDPSRDDSIDAFVGTDESLPAQAVPISAPQSPSTLSAPIAHYRRRRTMQGPMKMVRPQPTLSPSTLALITEPSRKRSRPSSSSSAGPPHKRCRVSPTPTLLAPTLPFIPMELPPPRKRFCVVERMEAAEREIESLIARLAVAEIQIATLQREDTSWDIKEVGINARLRSIEDTLRRR